MAGARLAPAARALIVLSLFASSSAWLGSTLAVTGPGAADRSPVLVFAPNTRSSAKLPLVLLLHGRCDNALGADASFHFANLVDQSSFVLAVPEATRSDTTCAACSSGLLGARTCRPWAATAACCKNLTSVDDSAYLMNVLASVKSKYAVDEQRIFIAGQDAGGFMAYRMACDHPETFAGIMSLNGAMYANASQCAAFAGSRPVSVLEVHGKSDTVVPYVGGTFEGAAVPGALASATLWAQHNGCGAPVRGASVELLRHGVFTAGSDTEVLNFGQCRAGSGVSLWSITGLGADVDATTFTAQFARDVLAFFLLHPQGGAAQPPTGGVLAVDQFQVATIAPAPAPRTAARAAAPAAAVPRTALQNLLAGAARSPPPPSSPPPRPPPPRPPTLLSLIRAAVEAREAASARLAPAPAPARAHAPAPAPARASTAPAPAPAGGVFTVTAMSGPPSDALPPPAASTVSDNVPPPAGAPSSPPPSSPPPATMPPPATPPPVVVVAASPPPAALGVDSLLSATDLMAVLSNREALKSLIGAGLASNTLLPDDIKAQLANPAVQAVLTAAVNSADPAKFIMDALSSAGVDVSELLGAAGVRMPAAPAPAPGPAHDLHEVRPFALQPPPPKSGAAAVQATVACVAAAAAALLLI